MYKIFVLSLIVEKLKLYILNLKWSGLVVFALLYANRQTDGRKDDNRWTMTIGATYFHSLFYSFLFYYVKEKKSCNFFLVLIFNLLYFFSSFISFYLLFSVNFFYHFCQKLLILHLLHDVQLKFPVRNVSYVILYFYFDPHKFLLFIFTRCILILFSIF